MWHHIRFDSAHTLINCIGSGEPRNRILSANTTKTTPTYRLLALSHTRGENMLLLGSIEKLTPVLCSAVEISPINVRRLRSRKPPMHKC
nr:unnamed protein product [Callosobruchus chinensis]